MSKYTTEELKTLSILLECHDDGQYLKIYNRIQKALSENRINIRFSFLDKDYLGYKLESKFLTKKRN
jgi:hypothetical protein